MKHKDKTEDKVTNELTRMHQRIAQLEAVESKRKYTEKALQFSHQFLEIANRHTEMAPFLTTS